MLDVLFAAPPNWLVPLPVLLPLVGAGLTLVVGGRDQLQRTVSMVVFVGVLAAVVLDRHSMVPIAQIEATHQPAIGITELDVHGRLGQAGQDEQHAQLRLRP